MGDGDVIFDRVADLTDGPAVLTHVARTDNPHATTAAQVGAYTTAQADTLLAGKASTAHAATHAAAGSDAITIAESQVTNLTTDLAAKAPLASPALTGTPTAPTAASATNTTQLATTAFVQAVIALLVNSSPATLDTLKELADALGDDPNFATTITTLIGTKLAKASNLSDLADASTARTNLGLGTAATLAADEAATPSTMPIRRSDSGINAEGIHATNFEVNDDGSASFAGGGISFTPSGVNGEPTIGGDAAHLFLGSNGEITLNPDGSAYFGGTLSGLSWTLDSYGNFSGNASYANEAGYASEAGFADNFYGSIDASQIGSGILSTGLLPTIPVANGGTNITSCTTGNLLYASGTNTWAAGSPDTAGVVAKSGTQTGIAGNKTWTGNHTIARVDIPAQISTSVGNFLRIEAETGSAYAEPVWKIGASNDMSKAMAIRGNGLIQFVGGILANGDADFNVGAASGSRAYGMQRGSGQMFYLGEEGGGGGERTFTFDGVSGTAASQGFKAKTSTTNSVQLAEWLYTWPTATHASRIPSASLVLTDYGGSKTVLSATTDGTNPLVSIGGGTQFKKILSATATLDFGSLAAGTVADLTLTVTGAATGDSVSLGVPTASVIDNVSYTGWVSAADTVTVRASNDSLLTARDPASGSFRATVVHF